MERARTPGRCPKMKNARAKRAKLLFFIANMQIDDVVVAVVVVVA